MSPIRVILTATVLAALSGRAAAQLPVDTSFSYQGRLTDGGAAATGMYDFEFQLFDAASGGAAMGAYFANDIQVNGGLFSTMLDFGPEFGMQKRWLQIAVRPGASSGAYTTLNARQGITGVPYSIGPWAPGLDGPTCYSGDNSYVTIDKDFGNIHANGGNDGTFGIFSEGPAGGSFAIVTGNTARLTVRNDSGNVGIGTTTPPFKFSVVTTAGDTAVYGQTDGAGNGVYGTNNASGTFGILGTINEGVYGAASGSRYGGRFIHFPSNNQGLLGGPNQGVYGTSTNGRGVEGLSANAVGVSGDCTSTGNYGFLGTPAEGIFGKGITGPGVRAIGDAPGLGGAALSTYNSSSGGIAILSQTASSDANLVISQVGAGDAIRTFNGSSGGPVFQVLADGSVVVDASSQYSTVAPGNHPRLRFGGGGSGEYIASERVSAVPDRFGLTFSTADTIRMYLRQNGEFVVNSNAFKPGGGSWSSLSDQRLKKDIQPLEQSLEKLLTLQGTSYEYINPTAVHELAGRRVGLIAQNVEQVFPDWVSTNEDGYKAVTVRGFEALAIEAFRELRAEKDQQIEQLKNDNEQLRLRLDRLEALLSSPEAR